MLHIAGLLSQTVASDMVATTSVNKCTWIVQTGSSSMLANERIRYMCHNVQRIYQR